MRPELESYRVPPLTLAAGIAVCRAVNSFGLRSSLKWPNDVVVGAPRGGLRKLAGVLTESVASAHRVAYVVVGIGVNVRTKQFPAEIAGLSTSMALEAQINVGIHDLRDLLLRELECWFDRYIDYGVSGIAPVFEKLALSGRIRARDLQGNQVEGKVAGLNSDGTLRVRIASDRTASVRTGSVEYADDTESLS